MSGVIVAGRALYVNCSALSANCGSPIMWNRTSNENIASTTVQSSAPEEREGAKKYCSNALIIHHKKTKKITTVTMVWICVPSYHKISPILALNFSKNY